MAWNYTHIFAYPSVDAVEEYVYVNSADITFAHKIQRNMVSAVGFPITYSRGNNYNYPIVMDDFTTTSYPFKTFSSMDLVNEADVPKAIKTRFTKWAKVQ